jgi:hypothetical protein
MKGYYLGATVSVLATLLLQGPIQNEELGLPMNGLQSTAMGYLIGLLTIMASGMYTFWRNHPFNVGELPEWIITEQSPQKRLGDDITRIDQESKSIDSESEPAPLAFEPSLEELPIPPISGKLRKAKTLVLTSLNKKIPRLRGAHIIDLVEEFPCPYNCETERAGEDTGE